MPAIQTAGIGPESGQYHPVGVGEKTGPAQTTSAEVERNFWVEMSGYFSSDAALPRLVPENQRDLAEFRSVAAREHEWGRIMVAGDPDPVSPRDQGEEGSGIVTREGAGSGLVIEAVTKADDPAWIQGTDFHRKAVEGLDGLVGREQRAAVPRDPLGLCQMQIGDAEKAGLRPPQRAAGAGDEVDTGQGQHMSFHMRGVPEPLGAGKNGFHGSRPASASKSAA